MSRAVKRRRLGRPRGPSVATDQRRLDLLGAAERAIRRLGARASMDDLAAEAGLTKPILYKQFGGKQGLAAALGERFATDILSSITSEQARAAEPEAVLRAACDAFITFVEGDPEIYRFVVQDALRSAGRPQLVIDLGARIAELLSVELDEADADTAAAEAWAFALIGAAFAAAEWWTATRTVDRDQLVDWITALMWGGLSSAVPSALRSRNLS